MTATKAEHKKGKALVALMFGPLIGLLYIICLPFIAIATVMVLGIRKVIGGLFNLLAHLMSFEWRPAETYLAGKKKAKKKNDQTND
jgi:hypothetical protein